MNDKSLELTLRISQKNLGTNRTVCTKIRIAEKQLSPLGNNGELISRELIILTNNERKNQTMVPILWLMLNQAIKCKLELCYKQESNTP